MVGRRKCSECRKWFTPGPTADHQKTCCEKCRRERRCRLARKRRLADLEAYREDEKQRQRRHREGMSAKPREPASRGPRHGPVGSRHGPASGCHGPASTRNRLEFQPVLAEIVDKVLEVSRATLERELLINIEQFGGKVAQAGDGGPVSRATLPR